MGKFIAKTALITVGAIVALTLLCYGFFALFLPGTLSSFYENIGATDAAINCAERQYEKTNDRKDLKRLVELIAFGGKETDENLKKMALYGVKLCDGEQFVKEECAAYGEKGGNYYLLMTSKTAKAVYLSGDKSLAVKKAEEYLKNCLSSGKYMYSGSAIKSLLVTSCDKKDNETVLKITDVIKNLDETKISDEDKVQIENDLEKVKNL